MKLCRSLVSPSLYFLIWLTLYFTWNTFNVLVQHVVNHRINVLVHILKQDGEAILDSKLQLLQKIGVVERYNLQIKYTRVRNKALYFFSSYAIPTFGNASF